MAVLHTVYNYIDMFPCKVLLFIFSYHLFSSFDIISFWLEKSKDNFKEFSPDYVELNFLILVDTVPCEHGLISPVLILGIGSN